jgi:hypothetical protein
LRKSLSEADTVVYLLRLNFLGSAARKPGGQTRRGDTMTAPSIIGQGQRRARIGSCTVDFWGPAPALKFVGTRHRRGA